MSMTRRANVLRPRDAPFQRVRSFIPYHEKGVTAALKATLTKCPCKQATPCNLNSAVAAPEAQLRWRYIQCSACGSFGWVADYTCAEGHSRAFMDHTPAGGLVPCSSTCSTCNIQGNISPSIQHKYNVSKPAQPSTPVASNLGKSGRRRSACLLTCFGGED